MTNPTLRRSAFLLVAITLVLSLVVVSTCATADDSSSSDPSSDPSSSGEDTGPPPDPATFDDAYLVFEFMRQQEVDLRATLAEANTDADKRAAAALVDEHVTEMIRIGSVGLGLADRSTPVDRIQKLRYLVCYKAYQAQRFEEAGLIGTLLGRELAQADAKTALGAAYIGFYSFQKLHAAADRGNRDFETGKVVEAATLLDAHWPTSAQAEAARVQVAGVLYASRQYDEAAAWYAKVPEKSSKYVEAQLVGGRAAFSAYGRAVARKGDAALSADERNARLEDVRKRLDTGIQRTEAQLDAKAPAPDNLVYAKYARAQVHVASAEYDAALELLVGKSHPVLPATNVTKGQQRPATGIKSRAFAAKVEELLLRIHVGQGKLDEAQQVVARIEALGGDSGSVTVYVNLGRQLREELERLNAAGETGKVTELATAFDALLVKLLERSAELDANTLRWVGSTYAVIGGAVPEGGDAYARKAAEVFDGMIARAGSDASFRELLTTIRLAKAEALATSGDANGALAAVADVLKANPRALEAQVAAAGILEADGEKEPAAYLRAINGTTHAGAELWGWAGIAKRLRPLTEQDDPSPTLVATYRDATYQSAALRLEYGFTRNDEQEGRAQFGRAALELSLFARAAGELDDETWERFDELYQDVLAAMQAEATPLPRAGADAASE